MFKPTVALLSLHFSLSANDGQRFGQHRPNAVVSARSLTSLSGLQRIIGLFTAIVLAVMLPSYTFSGVNS